MVASGVVDEEAMAVAKAQLEKLEKQAVAKSSKAKAAKAAEYAPLMQKVAEFLGSTEYALASEVGAVVGLSTQKAQAVLKKLVEAGQVTVFDVKVEKVGMRKAYKLV